MLQALRASSDIGWTEEILYDIVDKGMHTDYLFALLLTTHLHTVPQSDLKHYGNNIPLHNFSFPLNKFDLLRMH